MSSQVTTPQVDVDDMAASADVGGRQTSGLTRKVILGVALLWSLFQIWIASPLPYMVDADWLRLNGNGFG